MNTSEIKFTELVKSVCLFVIVTVLTITVIQMRNPDSDMYWMIETGRWIYKNKAVPYINPWISTNGMSIIVQQPICAIMNYFFYCILGLKHLWIAAVIENIILLFVSYQVASKLYNSKFPNKDKIYFFLIGELILLNCGMTTTRPYIITTMNMVILVGSLFIYKKDHDFKKLMAIVCIVTLFQANFQMASLIAIPCFISCFFIGEITKDIYLKEKPNIKSLFKWIFLYLEFAVISMINPYGINGSLYLFKSKKAIGLLKNIITETQSPKMLSTLGIIVLLAILSILFLIKKKIADAPLIYLCFGSIFSTVFALRNAWMLYVYFVFCFIRILPCIKNLKLYSKVPKALLKVYRMMLIFVTIIVCFAGILQLEKEKSVSTGLEDLFEIVSQIPDKEKIYTTFNTGGFVEFLGKTCYIDARPELYESSITNNNNILQEWYDLEYSEKINIDEFIKKHDFNYYLIRKQSNLDVYFKYHGKNLIWENEKYILYKIEEDIDK